MSSNPPKAAPAVAAPSPVRAFDSSGPRVIHDGNVLRREIIEARTLGKSVGLVPTMGALHEGHLSLVDAARAECDLVTVSIFVNPLQFAPTEDFRRYPRDRQRDLALLRTRGCDLVFAPNEGDMYAAGYATSIDVGPIGSVLEGEIRPTHFRGVATVVLKLFMLAPADRVYFGRKDYQQTLVVKQMVNDLNVPIDVRVCPIVREADGLAMSSRNAYLLASERQQSLALSRSLQLAERLVRDGERNAGALDRAVRREIGRVSGVDLQYVAVLADGTVEPVETITGPTTIAIAAKVGKTRLIDNTLVVP